MKWDSIVSRQKRRVARVIVVLSGVTPRQDFENYEPLAVLESIRELPQVLATDNTD